MLIKKYKRLILYAIFGIITTLVNIFTYYVCSRILEFNVLTSTIIAWLLAVCFAFFTNKIWVFESKSKKLKVILIESLSFFTCRILTGILDIFIMYIFVDKLNFNDLLIKTISNILVIILNYIASKMIIFKDKKEKLYNWKELLIILFIFVLAFVFSMKSPSNFLLRSEPYTDSSVFKLVGLLMSKGFMPYLHTFDHKGPLLYIINYFGYIINSEYGIWIIEVFVLFFSFIFIYKIAHFQNGKIISLVILLFVIMDLFNSFQGGNLTEEFALPFILISLYIFYDYIVNNKITNLRIIICGICFASVCLIRINMIACWAVFCIAIFIKSLMEKDYKNLINYTFNFITGFLIVTLPIMIWLIIKGAFPDFIQQYFIFNFKYSSSDGLFSKWNAFFNFANSLILTISLLVNLYAIFKEENQRIYIINFIFIIISLLSISISGKLYYHYAMILIPTFIIPISYFFHILLNKNNEISIIFTIYLLANLIVPSWESLIKEIGIMYSSAKNNVVNISDETITIKNLIVENTNVNDKITVYGNWASLYLLSERMPASKYSYQTVGKVSAKIYKEYFKDLEKNHPKIIVIENGCNDNQIQKFINKYKYKKLWSNEKGVLVYKL